MVIVSSRGVLGFSRRVFGDEGLNFTTYSQSTHETPRTSEARRTWSDANRSKITNGMRGSFPALRSFMP